MLRVFVASAFGTILDTYLLDDYDLQVPVAFDSQPILIDETSVQSNIVIALRHYLSLP